jgi:hypothetical protein
MSVIAWEYASVVKWEISKLHAPDGRIVKNSWQQSNHNLLPEECNEVQRL